MIGGIGIDIVESKRIESLWKAYGDHFLKKILSDDEIAAMPKKFPVQYIGGRFALKEAIVKASGKRDFAFNEISVLNDETGKPFIKEKDAIARIIGREESSFAIHVSISHEKEYCTASAVIEFL
ncbi:MAG: holo-ACP synthase [Leptospirales bacterium]|nr:holo-ACP synthase [Leptospirales bacterium]